MLLLLYTHDSETLSLKISSRRCRMQVQVAGFNVVDGGGGRGGDE
jgi:hypothetical protein